MNNQTFNAIYNSTEQDKKAQNKDIVFRRNLRAVESSIDSLEDLKMETEDSLNKELAVVGKGGVIEVQKVTELRATIKDADAQIEDLKAFRDEFFAETPVKKTRGKSPATKLSLDGDSKE